MRISDWSSDVCSSDLGDVIWVDTGIHVGGYASDFGRTWIVGDDPALTPRQQAQFDRWWAVMEAVLALCTPGATERDLAQRSEGRRVGQEWCRTGRIGWSP